MIARNYASKKLIPFWYSRIFRKKPYLRKNKTTKFIEQYMESKYDIGEDIYFDNAYLPNCYFENNIVLMSKNKTTIFCYWEIREDDFLKLKNEHNIKDEVVIRLYSYDVHIKDIYVNSRLGSYYITQIEGDKKYRAKIGYFDNNGTFYEMAKSKNVVVPSGIVSQNIGYKWGIAHKRLDNSIYMHFFDKFNLTNDFILNQELLDGQLIESGFDSVDSMLDKMRANADSSTYAINAPSSRMK